MSCKKWEESVYLYHELTANEQKQVDVHLGQCAECSVLFESLHQMKQMIHQVVGDKAVIKDSVLLTNKIMKALSSESASSAGSTVVFASLIDNLFTRYALGAASLLLISFFVNEQKKEVNFPKQEILYSGSKASIPLDTKAFMKAITQNRSAENSLYLCIKSNQCEYGIVKYFKQMKNNENI